jgi:hypothetical protein
MKYPLLSAIGSAHSWVGPARAACSSVVMTLLRASTIIVVPFIVSFKTLHCHSSSRLSTSLIMLPQGFILCNVNHPRADDCSPPLAVPNSITKKDDGLGSTCIIRQMRYLIHNMISLMALELAATWTGLAGRRAVQATRPCVC